MPRKYEVKRKLQEQSGSYFVIIPKIWIEALGLKESDDMSVIFNGEVRIKPSGDSEKLDKKEEKD
jgi:antitoxin component of MazEF toxin-antitoxin module